MKFTYSWLQEYLDTDIAIDALSETLTDIGLEVEEIQNNAAELAPFTVAEILKAEKHPDADKLQICEVNAHDGARTIVCGAPNARAGIKVALADIGAVIPHGGFKIKKSKIRGVESCGMLCSATELGIGTDSAGIIELPTSAEVGQSIVDIPELGLDDILIEIAITPNRGDCLGVYGIARDLAAAGVGTLKQPDFAAVKGNGTAPARTVTIESEACKLFVSREIQNVQNGESPAWLQDRLKSVGLRPISALVDITNYITMAFGRPLHIYDADALKGALVVRNSRAGEPMEALDDKAYTLPDGLCVIADEAGLQAIGGVVGSTASGCTDNTTNILIEAAWFQPEAVAQAGRMLGAESDARYRFERTVDPEFTQTGAELATRMVLELCGTDTTEVSDIAVAGEAPNLSRSTAFSSDDVERLGGVSITQKECQSILEKLGFTVTTPSGSADWNVENPSYRPDIAKRADLVEEILRIKRYSSIPEIALPVAKQHPKVNVTENALRLIRRTLAGRGMNGAYHFAFSERSHAETFMPLPEVTKDATIVEVINPISNDMSCMRTHLLPNLLGALSRNLARDAKNIALFEVGNIFFGTSPEAQPLMAAGIRSGKRSGDHWQRKAECVDIFDAKADLFALLALLGVDTDKVKITNDAPGWYHPGKSARVSLGGKITLGYFGAIHPRVQRQMDISQDAVAFELYVDNIPQKRKKVTQPEAVKLSDFQASRRDFAFIVDAQLPAQDLLNAARNANKKLLKRVDLFDVYAGKGVPEGKKSLAITAVLQASDRTLSEEDINNISDKIITSAQKLGAELR